KLNGQQEQKESKRSIGRLAAILLPNSVDHPVQQCQKRHQAGYANQPTTSPSPRGLTTSRQQFVWIEEPERCDYIPHIWKNSAMLDSVIDQEVDQTIPGHQENCTSYSRSYSVR